MEKKKPSKTPPKKPVAKPKQQPEKLVIYETDTQHLPTWSCPPLVVGRPPLYTRPQQLAEKIAEYFDKGCIRKTKSTYMGIESEQVRRIPTISGLATYCGFSGRDSFYKQADRNEEFLYIVKWAKSNIESFHEENIASGNPCTGSIWWTKCHGDWKDTSAEKTNSVDALEYEVIN